MKADWVLLQASTMFDIYVHVDIFMSFYVHTPCIVASLIVAIVLCECHILFYVNVLLNYERTRNGLYLNCKNKVQ